MSYDFSDLAKNRVTKAIQVSMIAGIPGFPARVHPRPAKPIGIGLLFSPVPVSQGEGYDGFTG